MPERHGAFVTFADAVEVRLRIWIVIAKAVDGVVVNQHVDLRLIQGNDRHNIVMHEKARGRIIQIDAVDVEQPPIIGHALIVGDLRPLPVRHPCSEAVGVTGQERGVLEKVIYYLTVNRVDAEHAVAGAFHRVVGKELFLACQLERNGTALFREMVKIVIHDPVSLSPDHQHISAFRIGQFAVADLVALAVQLGALLVEQLHALETAVGRRLGRHQITAVAFDVFNDDEFFPTQVHHRPTRRGFDLERGGIRTARRTIIDQLGFCLIDPLVIRSQQRAGA